MPRGSNSSAETDRVKSKEIEDTRAAGKSGSGVAYCEKTGFGGGSMQKNPGKMKKPSF